MIFFEQAKEQAEGEVEKNPNDTSALTRWGGALLELAHFRQGHEAFDMIEQARGLPACWQLKTQPQHSIRVLTESLASAGSWQVPSRTEDRRP